MKMYCYFADDGNHQRLIIDVYILCIFNYHDY